MTNEKMLELLNEGFFNNSDVVNTCRLFEIDVTKLFELQKALKDNIRHEVQKSKGTVKDETIIKRLIKKNNVAEYHKGFMSTNYNNIDYSVFFFDVGMLLNSDTTETYGYEKAPEPIDSKAINNIITECASNITSNVEVDIEQLKYFCKVNKPAKNENPTAVKFDYEVNGTTKTIGLNPHYLLDVLTYCKTNRIYITGEFKPITVLSEDENKRAILCPTRIISKAKYLSE